MDERIKEHLQHLNKYYLLLQKTKDIEFDQFRTDPVQQASAERFLQLAIESCLNIGNRMISLLQFDKAVKPPETYADIFVELESLGVVGPEFSKRLIQMAKFRNRLVHLYWDLDQKAVYDSIQNNLDDFKLFQERVVSYLKTMK